MSIIHKYLTTEVLKYFCLVLIAVVGIYTVVDFFEKIDDLFEANLSVSRSLVFFGLRIPLIISQVAPVGLFLAVIIVFGLMVKHNETVALQSGGVSIYYLLRPVLGMGLIFAALVFFFNEALVPISLAGANRIWTQEVKKKSSVTAKKRNLWVKGHRSIFHISYFKPSDKTIFGITLNYFDDDFRLVKRIDAEKGVYTGGIWHLSNVIQQDLVKTDGSYEITQRTDLPVRLEFAPEDLNKVVKKGEEMSYSDLSAYIRDIETEGYDATGYRVDRSAKIAFPFVCVIMGVVGTGLSLWRKRKEGLAGTLFYGIGLAFVYWTLYSFCLSLGYGKMLPPIVAAWLTNVIFISFGTLLVFKAA